MNKCKYCNIENYVRDFPSLEYRLCDGCIESIYILYNQIDKKYYIEALGEGKEEIEIQYCPFCGRKLQEGIMNKTELQQKIVDMEKQLVELKKELEKKDKGIWKPDKDETYYYIGEYGTVQHETNTTDTDYAKIEFGNYFIIRPDAEKYRNYLKYTNLLRKYVEEHSEPIDWNSNQNKCSMWFNTDSSKIFIESGDCYPQQGTIYASSEEILRDAIEFVGEDNIKKYIFGVEE